jgi:hypothetical protein
MTQQLELEPAQGRHCGVPDCAAARAGEHPIHPRLIGTETKTHHVGLVQRDVEPVPRLPVPLHPGIYRVAAAVPALTGICRSCA